MPKETIKIAYYFVVALKILEFQEKGKPIWFGKLVEELKDELTKTDIERALGSLYDWFIAKSSYGEYELGKAGLLLTIDTIAIEIVRKIKDKTKGKEIVITYNT